ncbi:MAG: hypothetical protein PHO27_04095 [Sulfuricurvum sp.]|nr:hypothetical protein [Sulfuricurvum sp.]
MLFYNHKQEFIGIDEEGLKLLNYTSLEELLGVCTDVADLFAKEPGYIHNFKSFGWIDFLLHADSDATSAIVHGNGRTFSCTLHVQKLFLCEEPASNGYMIEMLHVLSINGDDIKPHVITPKAPQSIKPAVASTPAEVKHEPQSSLPNYTHITPTKLSEPGTLDIPSFEENELGHIHESAEDLYAKLALPLNDEELEFKIEPEVTPPATPVIPAAAKASDRPMLGDTTYSNAEKGFINSLKTDKSYRFDPNVAASELGLPVDLIEEFIGDFIQQSYEFKQDLFGAVLKGDFNNLKILSHKLKGVAANLRIEDAFESLSIINTSNDPVEVEANLKYFYTIISKLEGKEEEEPADEINPFTLKEDLAPLKEVSPVNVPNDDIYDFGLKQTDHETLLVQEKDIKTPDIAQETEDENDLYTMVTSDAIEESPIDEPTFLEHPTDDVLHYDKKSVAGTLGIDHDFFEELINDFKHDALLVSGKIANAIEAFDTHSWKQTASEFIGISDNLRLNEISEEFTILSSTNDAQEAHKASKRLNSLLNQL